MRYERQGQDECLLASYAMLTGRSLSDIRERTMEIARGIAPLLPADWRMAWRWITDSSWGTWGGLFWPTVQALAKDLGMPTPAVGVGIGVGWDRDVPDLSGRGVLTIRVGWMLNRHAVVYEDGLIYDPARPETAQGVTWEAFSRLYYGDVVIAEVLPVKEEKNGDG